jgi:16S rRNA (guanine527-N7)-methyltransferase
MDQTTSRLLMEEATRHALVLPPSVTGQLVEFVELLSRWGQRINLTARPDPQSIIQLHLPDAFVLTAALAELGPLTRAVDVGSGGGLPGLALAILRPELHVTLVEPRARRAAFLRTAIHALHLTVTVVAQRIESLALAPQDLACSCATFTPVAWLRLARPLISHGGRIAVFASLAQDLPRHVGDVTLRSQVSYRLVSGAARVLALYHPEVSRETAA